jgi:DUF971 family protein
MGETSHLLGVPAHQFAIGGSARPPPSQAVLQTGKKTWTSLEVKPGGPLRAAAGVRRRSRQRHLQLGLPVPLCTQQRERWQAYLEELRAAGASRDPDTQVLHFDP